MLHQQTVPNSVSFLHITSKMDEGEALYSKYDERHNEPSKMECEKSDNAACSCVLNKVKSYFTHIIQSVFTVDSKNTQLSHRRVVVAGTEINPRFVHSYIVHQFTKNS